MFNVMSQKIKDSCYAFLRKKYDEKTSQKICLLGLNLVSFVAYDSPMIFFIKGYSTYFGCNSFCHSILYILQMKIIHRLLLQYL